MTDQPSLRTSRKKLAWRRRDGALLHEAVMAITLSGVLLGGISQLLALAGQQRQSARQRFVAREELANLMEEVMSRPWSDITTDRLATLHASEPARELLPDVQVRVQASDENETTRRIEMELSWLTRHGGQRQSLSLVAWNHAEQRP